MVLQEEPNRVTGTEKGLSGSFWNIEDQIKIKAFSRKHMDA